jgi:hypothetical protein
MIIKANEKELEIIPKTRNLSLLAQRLGCKNLQKHLMTAAVNTDIYTLAVCLVCLSGKEPMKDLSEIYDFIDEYVAQEGNALGVLYEDVIAAINDGGFFNQKKNRKELIKEMHDPISMLDMGEIMERAMDSAAATAISAKI